MFESKCIQPACKNADVTIVWKSCISKNTLGFTPNSFTSIWLAEPVSESWYRKTRKLIVINDQVKYGLVGVGFSSEIGKKTNIISLVLESL